MQTKSRRLSDLSTAIGFALAFFGFWLAIYRDGYGREAWPLIMLGCSLMFGGFWFYIRAKGYHPAWSFLFFIFGPAVFLVFFYLPDRSIQIHGRNSG
jgi:hypothetical protein